MNRNELLMNALKKRILILDGAMGTMIQKYKLEEEHFRGTILESHDRPLKGNNDLLSLTQPKIIKEIHKKYLEAGADIIETNTFSSTKISQADYALEDKVYDLNFQSAKIAKEVANEFTKMSPSKPRFVAGSVGPTNRTASISPDVDNPSFRAVIFKELVDNYKEQAKALIDGKVDMIIVETVFDTLNAKAAIIAITEVQEVMNVEIPIMVSGTITDKSGRTLSGQTTHAFLISLQHFPLLSIGLNCALGANDMKQYLRILSKESDFYVSAHPNAGLPNELGEYDETPEMMTAQIQQYLDENLVNIVGGCCGTEPKHIKMISELAKKYAPRNIAEYHKI